MKVKRTEIVELSKIKANLFVRRELDQDHVMYLAELIDGGVKMRDNVKVNEDFEVIDGRHRKEAYELCKAAEIKVDIISVEDEIHLIAEAYKANTGGSKPPTTADTEHTIMLLLERGQTIKSIGELIALPPAMARRYVNEVKSRMNRAKIQRAAAAITDGGLTVAKAAEQYGVDQDKLKEALSGYRRKHKHGIEELQKGLTITYKSVSSKNTATMRRVLEKYEDGDVAEKQVRAVFNHIESLQKKSSKAIADWKARFEAITGTKKEEQKLTKSA